MLSQRLLLFDSVLYFILIAIPFKFASSFNLPLPKKSNGHILHKPSSQLFSTSSSQEEESLLFQRRNFLGSTCSAFGLIFSQQTPAEASGGATAGKYTTIPIAKRRYYGRVQEAIHEFLLMSPSVLEGDMTAPCVQKFFDVKATVIVPATVTSGVCTKKADGSCKGAEITDSRWNDMKTSMYLLGNAFRINQTKPPDALPTVKAAKNFFKEIDTMEKVVVKTPKKNIQKAQTAYVNALDILDEYLDLVELPPTDSGHYDKEFSTNVGKYSRIT